MRVRPLGRLLARNLVHLLGNHFIALGRLADGGMGFAEIERDQLAGGVGSAHCVHGPPRETYRASPIELRAGQPLDPGKYWRNYCCPAGGWSNEFFRLRGDAVGTWLPGTTRSVRAGSR